MTAVTHPQLPARLRNHGQLHHSDLARVWPDATYPPPLRAVLLQLLHTTEVAYPARDESGSCLGYSVVPAMLAEEEPVAAVAAWRAGAEAAMPEVR